MLLSFQKRGQEEFNAKLSEEDINKYCVLDEKALSILSTAIQKYSLNHRSIAKIKKISRTIADLDQSEVIKSPHVLEALNFRHRG